LFGENKEKSCVEVAGATFKTPATIAGKRKIVVLAVVRLTTTPIISYIKRNGQIRLSVKGRVTFIANVGRVALLFEQIEL